MIFRATLVWLVIAVAETVHGIIRVRLLNRHLGDKRARRVSVLSGSLIIFLIALGTVRWIGVDSSRDCLVIGGLWLVLMLAFDFGLGRFYFGFSWKRLLADLDPRQGGLLGFGMTFLFFAPLLAAGVHGFV